MPHMHRIVYDMYQEIVAEMNAQQQQVPYDHRRTRQGGGGGGGGNCPPNFEKPWKFGQMLGKIKKIRADLSENMLKSRYFITILHKNSVKLSTAPPPPPPPRKTSESRSPMSMTICTWMCENFKTIIIHVIFDTAIIYLVPAAAINPTATSRRSWFEWSSWRNGSMYRTRYLGTTCRYWNDSRSSWLTYC
jgi:hypothetical protein